MQVNAGLIKYRGPGADDPLVRAQLAHNKQLSLTRDPAIDQIDASDQRIDDDDF